jgi:hypothetical protein
LADDKKARDARLNRKQKAVPDLKDTNPSLLRSEEKVIPHLNALLEYDPPGQDK